MILRLDYRCHYWNGHNWFWPLKECWAWDPVQHARCAIWARLGYWNRLSQRYWACSFALGVWSVFLDFSYGVIIVVMKQSHVRVIAYTVICLFHANKIQQFSSKRKRMLNCRCLINRISQSLKNLKTISLYELLEIKSKEVLASF